MRLISAPHLLTKTKIHVQGRWGFRFHRLTRRNNENDLFTAPGVDACVNLRWTHVAPVLTACSGFLFAVLWMDLIFDAQIFGHHSAGRELPESVLASIAGYYHRATTTSRPMSRLIALVMLILLGALGVQAALGRDPGWLLVVSAGLAGAPMTLALTRTVPDAVRLGHRTGNAAEQTRLARSICRDHLVCVSCMVAFLVLWVVRSAAV